ncbi:hypothetical protein CPB84DRAFT_1855579 [Gymnopilus junonius]|uniref:HNH nuclease domain-containing protein n=1 Tax=Gymnopilus junonius TaxID=109634 RepID=A0A9P5N7R3_GYMJU|nr:hypothetical protein CPB84DRAFT_1855579 [Gymnopilus junonius]
MATPANSDSLLNPPHDSDSSTIPDNELDGDYELSDAGNLPFPTDIYTTPLKRAILNSLPQYIKDEIDKITCNDPRLSKKRCIIENIEEINAVQYAHLLSRSTPNSIITSLEYSWGLQPGHLNVDSRFNIFRLNARLHYAFDRGYWLLIPSPTILREFENHKQRGPKNNNFMNICKDQGPFEYNLVPMKKMMSIPIHRQVDSPNRPVIPREKHFTYHHFPFHSFPTIKSHVHPRYVIFNAGQKMANRLYYELTFRNELKSVKAIYDAWIEPAPLLPEWETAEDKEDKEGDRDDKSNNKEGDNQSHRSYHTRSAHWDAQSDVHTGSPPSKRVRERGGKITDPSQTLVDISEPLSLEEKKGRIMNWVEDVARKNDEMHSMVFYRPAAIEDHTLYDDFTVLIGILLTVWCFILDIPIFPKTPTLVAEAQHVDQVAMMRDLYL